MEINNFSANEDSNSKWENQIQRSIHRCKTISSQINSLPPSKLTDSCKQTLIRHINSELKHLSRLTFSSSQPILTLNIGYIQSILHILQQSSISKVSRVCNNNHSNGVYIDIVCTLNRNPVWIIVSDRNQKYVCWDGDQKGKGKGLRIRVEEVLNAAKKSCLMLKPVSVLLFFGHGMDKSVSEKLRDEFRAFEVGLESVFAEEIEDDWVNVMSVRCYEKAQTFQIMVDDCVENVVGFSEVDSRVREFNSGDAGIELFSSQTRVVLGEKFCSLLLSMRKLDAKLEELRGEDVLNFDTTALIALVSGITNGGTEKLLATPECELRARFKINYEFVIAQVMSELHKPILEELTNVISGKMGMICESVHLEFRELVSMCGGPNEKLRAEQLLKCILIVPDSPSARMMDILTTRKIALKNKVVFGTGDQWLAPTLTANMGFVRAISQTGMSLLTLEHRPRALTGD